MYTEIVKEAEKVVGNFVAESNARFNKILRAMTDEQVPVHGKLHNLGWFIEQYNKELKTLVYRNTKNDIRMIVYPNGSTKKVK